TRATPQTHLRLPDSYFHTSPAPSRGIARVLNDAAGQRLLQLQVSLVGHERVIQVELLQPLESRHVNHARVRQIHRIELQARQLRQPRQVREPRVADGRVSQVERFQVRQLADLRHAFVGGDRVLQIQHAQ